ncbi:early nodulin-like protein 15 [Nicotiana tabacum]|uniref:Early nodulin-like protein 15 n=2 Tax=Nicotiana TaxID=4085 RepID=A0A1S4C9Y6_TOBAC|nr:PREDICTED: early nodulin-like protein 3 [Nicotiana sylvestris]XP_016497926.1 PREDICTED: early nodulin-like protein 3 [Nicotiana tabacum]
MAGFSRNVLSSSSVVAVLFFFLLSFTEARDHLVGGKTDSWKIPSSESDSLNRWAEKSRFLIGDSLVWKYDAKKDSVIEVSKRDYVTCNTSSPIAVHNDGNTKIELTHSGAYYFISGEKGHCEQGQKLIVVTLSENNMRRFMGAPAPSPTEFDGPAMAPTSNAATLKAGLLMAFGVLMVFLF